MVSVTRRWFLASFLTTIVSGILMSGDLAKLGWAQSAESEKEEISGRKIEKMIQEIVQEKLSWVGLSGIENLKPAQLSGGMKKRVGLARAIAMEPECILYDEPTTGLDPIMADVINHLIIDMRNKLKVTSIAVTHDMVAAYKIADRIAMLYEGKIIFTGTPEETKNTTNPIVRQFIEGRGEGPIKAV